MKKEKRKKEEASPQGKNRAMSVEEAKPLKHKNDAERKSDLRLFLTRNIFDKYLGCLGPKYLSKIFLENITWERWEASYGSEIFFSLFDGGM